MSTLGVTTTGANSYSVNSGTTEWYYIGQMSEAGTLTNVSCEGWSLFGDGTGAGNFRLSVATGSSSAPSAKVSGGETGDIPFTTTRSIKSASISGSLNNGDHVWIGVTRDNTADFAIGKNAVADSANVYVQSSTYPTMTIGSSEGTFATNQPVMYITYTSTTATASGATTENAGDTSAGVAQSVLKGLRTPTIYEPNNDSVIADATGVRAVARDAIGGNEIFDISTATIVSGVCTIANSSLPALATNIDLELRWNDGSKNNFVCGTLAVINLNV